MTRRRGIFRAAVIYLLLLLFCVVFVAPFAWMISTSLKSPSDIISGLGALRWLSHPATLENYRYILGRAEEFPVWRWTATVPPFTSTTLANVSWGTSSSSADSASSTGSSSSGGSGDSGGAGGGEKKSASGDKVA